MDNVLNEFQVILLKISPSLENYQRNVMLLMSQVCQKRIYMLSAAIKFGIEI